MCKGAASQAQGLYVCARGLHLRLRVYMCVQGGCILWQLPATLAVFNMGVSDSIRGPHELVQPLLHVIAGGLQILEMRPVSVIHV